MKFNRRNENKRSFTELVIILADCRLQNKGLACDSDITL